MKFVGCIVAGHLLIGVGCSATTGSGADQKSSPSGTESAADSGSKGHVVGSGGANGASNSGDAGSNGAVSSGADCTVGQTGNVKTLACDPYRVGWLAVNATN